MKVKWLWPDLQDECITAPEGNQRTKKPVIICSHQCDKDFVVPNKQDAVLSWVQFQVKDLMICGFLHGKHEDSSRWTEVMVLEELNEVERGALLSLTSWGNSHLNRETNGLLHLTTLSFTASRGEGQGGGVTSRSRATAGLTSESAVWIWNMSRKTLL